MLQTLSSAFLAQFQNDEGQALTVVSESIPINDKIEVPFVLDNSVGRKVLTHTIGVMPDQGRSERFGPNHRRVEPRQEL